MKTSLLYYYKISIFEKENTKGNMPDIWVKITQYQALYLSMKLNTGNMQLIQLHVNKC